MSKKNVGSLGLDLSLVGTGLVIVVNGKLVAGKLIRSKPSGDLPRNELIRIRDIVGDIADFLEKHRTQLNIACIENLAFMARNTTALVQLSALNYMTRALLFDHGIPFVMVAPTSLKKFITGKGNSDKNVMMMQIYKDYGHTFLDDNLADGFALAAVGTALLEKPINKITQAQEEVLGLLKKQI